MQISTRLLLPTALALIAMAATSEPIEKPAPTAPTATPIRTATPLIVRSVAASSGASALAQTALAQTAKEPQAKASAEFIKLDAATLPIIKKIQIGGDADWLAIGFGSVWVTVAKNNEVVRVDPVRNVVQARVKVDKEPCYGIGIGVDRVWVLNCQGKTLTRINPKTNAVDMRVPVKIDDSGEGSIAVDERYVWYASNEDGHSSTLSQVEVKTGRKLKGIAVGKDTGVVKLAFGSVWAISSGEGNV
jgi:streptogramin lyase